MNSEPWPKEAGVEGSTVKRLHDLMLQLRYVFLGAEDAEHPSRLVMRYDAGDHLTAITYEDSEKPAEGEGEEVANVAK